MNSLKLAKIEINKEEVNTINARDLHTFLEAGKDFSNWIKARIEKYGFVENEDFIIVSEAPKTPFADSGERINRDFASYIKPIDYFISIDMAKELSMVENSEKGKVARRYFIECENNLKKIELAYKQGEISGNDIREELIHTQRELIKAQRELLIEKRKDVLITLSSYCDMIKAKLEMIRNIESK